MFVCVCVFNSNYVPRNGLELEGEIFSLLCHCQKLFEKGLTWEQKKE